MGSQCANSATLFQHPARLVAGARVGVPEVKVIELIPFPPDPAEARIGMAAPHSGEERRAQPSKAAGESRVTLAPSLMETFEGLSAGGTTLPRVASLQPAATNRRVWQRGRSRYPGSAASRFSIHSGVTPGRVSSSAWAFAFVWVMLGITAGVSPSSGWQANSRRMPLGS
jgi:hypothetical protein